ncbi:M56 family metallopeptidase [Lacipirellula sp.]|uniref:M56 family metallopeptidase n=1 Tax=Lacipirellula sp. TaxID=2691419 RepID=UPI003D09C06C
MNASLWQLAGWTMIHSLWLGAAVALAGGILRLVARRAAPSTRYAISLTTLAALAISPLAAAAWLSVNGVPIVNTVLLPPPGGSNEHDRQWRSSAGGSPSVAPGWGGGTRAGSGPQLAGSAGDIQDTVQSPSPLLHPSLTLPLKGREPEEQVVGEVIDLARLPRAPQSTGEWGDGFDRLPATAPANATVDAFPSAIVGSPSPSFSPARGAPLPADHQSPITAYLSSLAAAIPYLPILWLVGAPLTFTLLAAGLVGSERLRRRATPLVAGPAFDACQRMRTALRISRRVALAACDGVAQPVLVGVFRPLILLPTAALAGWTPEQLDMILLHELAHVRRWDNLVNLLQRIVESILFYHPAAWILSRQVRHDREECCDATVIRHTDRPHQYAELLVSIAAALRGGPAPSLAVASAMASHPLAGRIRRILNIEAEPMRITRRTLAATLLLPAILAGAILYSGASAENPPPFEGGARGGIPDANQPSTLASDERAQGGSANAEGTSDASQANTTATESQAQGGSGQPPQAAAPQENAAIPVTYPIAAHPVALSKFAEVTDGYDITFRRIAGDHPQWAVTVSAPIHVHEQLKVLLTEAPAAVETVHTPTPSATGKPSRIQAEISQLGIEVRNYEARIREMQQELANLAALKELANQSGPGSSALQVKVALEIAKDPTIQLYQQQIAEQFDKLQAALKDSGSPNVSAIKRLQTSLRQSEEELAQHQITAEKLIRKKLASASDESLRAQIAEYDTRSKAIEERLVGEQDNLETFRLRLLELLAREPGPTGGSAASAPGFAATRMLQPPRSTRTGLTGDISRTTAYLHTPPSKAFDPHQPLETQTMRHCEALVTRLRSKALLQQVVTSQSVAELPTVKNQSEPATWLQQRLKAYFPSDSEILAIHLEGGVAAEDEAILQEIIDNFIKSTNDPTGTPADSTNVGAPGQSNQGETVGNQEPHPPAFKPILTHNLSDKDSAPLIGGYGILQEFPANAPESAVDAVVNRLKADNRRFSVEQSEDGRRRIVDQTPPREMEILREIRRLESLVEKVEDEITNLEVFKELAVQSASSPEALNKAVAAELTSNREFNALYDRIVDLDRAIESGDGDAAKIDELKAAREKLKAELNARRDEVEKTIRDGLPEKQKETLRPTILEYDIRRKVADERLTKHQQELDAARQKLSQLGVGNAPAQPQPSASRTPSKAVGISDEATLKKAFESRPDNPTLTVCYALDQLPPEQYEDQWSDMFDGMKLDPYGPQLAFEHETTADKRHMTITAPVQAHREFFDTFFSGELLKAELAAPKQKSPGLVKEILINFLPELSKEDHQRILQEIKATGLSATITTRKPRTRSSAANRDRTRPIPCLSVLVPQTWQAKPVWETNGNGEKTLRIINEAESPLAQPADASPAGNQDAPTLGSSPTPPTGASPPPEALFANAAGSSSPNQNAPSANTAAPAPQPRPTPSSDWNLSAPAASSAPVPSLAPIDPASNPWGSHAAPQPTDVSVSSAINPQIVPEPTNQRARASSAWNQNTTGPYADVAQTSPFAPPYHANYATNGGIPADFNGLANAAKNKYDGSITWDEAFTTLHVYGPANLHADVQRYLQWLSTEDTTNPPSNLDLQAITGRHRKTTYELRKGSRPIVEAWFAEHPSHGLSYHIAEPNEAPNLVARGPKEAHEQLMAALMNLGILRSTSGEPPQPSAPTAAPPQSPPFPTLEHQRLADHAYKLLGLELDPLTPEELERVKKLGYNGGLRVTRADAMAGMAGIHSDDLFVGLHAWPINDLKSLDEVLNRGDLGELNPLKYYVVRNTATNPFGKQQATNDQIVAGRFRVDPTLLAGGPDGAAPGSLPANVIMSSSDFEPISIIQAPTTQKTGLTGETTTTAYLKLNFDRRPGALASAGGRTTPREIQRYAMNCLTLVESPTVLRAALNAVTPKNFTIAWSDDAVEQLQERLSASFPGDGEILQLELKGDEKIPGNDILLQAIINAFITSMQAPPESAAEANATPTSPPDAASGPTFLYDGKTFEQWRDLWKNELKTERRIEAINALAAFARAGYAQEATDAILAVAAEYPEDYLNTSAEGRLMDAVEEAIARISAEHWMPQVQERIAAAAEPEKKHWIRLAGRLLSSTRDTSESARALAVKFLQIPDDELLGRTAYYFYRGDQELSQPVTVETVRRALQADPPRISITTIGFRHVDKVPEIIDVFVRNSRERGQLRGPGVVDNLAVLEMQKPLLAILRSKDRSQDHLGTLRALKTMAPGFGHSQLAEPRRKIAEDLIAILPDMPSELQPATLATLSAYMGRGADEVIRKLAEREDIPAELIVQLQGIDQTRLNEELNAY